MEQHKHEDEAVHGCIEVVGSEYQDAVVFLQVVLEKKGERTVGVGEKWGKDTESEGKGAEFFVQAELEKEGGKGLVKKKKKVWSLSQRASISGALVSLCGGKDTEYIFVQVALEKGGKGARESAKSGGTQT